MVVGCTEPAAIAYAVQAARKNRRSPLDPDDFRLRLLVSPEVRRNASTAVVPGIGKRGVRAAAAAGLLAAAAEFNPFAELRPDSAAGLLRRSKWIEIETSRRGGVYIRADLAGGGETVTAVISGRHDRVAKVLRDGKTIFQAPPIEPPPFSSLAEIHRIASRGDRRLEKFARSFTERQVRGDPARSLEEELAGLVRGRMRGDPLPVLTFTGSGNQGMFLGVPLRRLYESRGDCFLPGAVFALLAQVHLSRVRKRISNDCGLAVKAAPALAGGIAFARGLSPAAVGRVMGGVARRLEGIDCRGALPGCGAKAVRCLRAVAAETGGDWP